MLWAYTARLGVDKAVLLTIWLTSPDTVRDLASAPHLKERQSCSSILHRVMRSLLDATSQQVRRQETKAELALALEVEELDGVNDLQMIAWPHA